MFVFPLDDTVHAVFDHAFAVLYYSSADTGNDSIKISSEVCSIFILIMFITLVNVLQSQLLCVRKHHYSRLLCGI